MNVGDTDSIERNERPIRPQSLKSFRPEDARVLTPDVLPAMQDVNRIIDTGLRRDEDRTLPIWPATTGKGGVFVGSPPIPGYDGPDSERLVDTVLEVLAALQGSKSDICRLIKCTKGFRDDAAELFEHGRVAEHLVEEPGQKRGGGVTAGKENVEELCANFVRIPGLLGKGLGEYVFVRFLFLWGGECGFNVCLDKFIDDFSILIKF